MASRLVRRSTIFILIVQESPPLTKLFDPTIASMAMVEKRFDSLLAFDLIVDRAILSKLG